MSNLFDEGNQPAPLPFNNPDQVTLSDLVGEGKKYGSEEDLAKALAHSQNHIQTLEFTQGEMKQELEQRVNLEQVLERLDTNQAPNDPPNNGPTPQEPTPPADPVVKGLTKDDVLELLSTRQTEQTQKQNLDQVSEALVTYTGSNDKAKEFLAAKSKELGIQPTQLQELAKTNPSFLLKSLGVEMNPKGSSNVLQVKPPELKREPNADNPTTLEDFKALRQKDLKAYFDPKNQRKLMALVRAEQQG